MPLLSAREVIHLHVPTDTTTIPYLQIHDNGYRRTSCSPDQLYVICDEDILLKHP